jgi:hypothetical protein
MQIHIVNALNYVDYKIFVILNVKKKSNQMSSIKINKNEI